MGPTCPKPRRTVARTMCSLPLGPIEEVGETSAAEEPVQRQVSEPPHSHTHPRPGLSTFCPSRKAPERRKSSSSRHVEGEFPRIKAAASSVGSLLTARRVQGSVPANPAASKETTLSFDSENWTGKRKTYGQLASQLRCKQVVVISTKKPCVQPAHNDSCIVNSPTKLVSLGAVAWASATTLSKDSILVKKRTSSPQVVQSRNVVKAQTVTIGSGNQPRPCVKRVLCRIKRRASHGTQGVGSGLKQAQTSDMDWLELPTFRPQGRTKADGLAEHNNYMMK